MTPFDDSATGFDGGIAFDGAASGAVGPFIVQRAAVFVAGAEQAGRWVGGSVVGHSFSPGAVEAEVTT